MSTGLGVMIRNLAWKMHEEDIAAAQACIGKELMRMEIDGDDLRLEFKDNTILRFWDNGQSCCEHRYMSTDDTFDLQEGETLVDIEIANGPSEEGTYGDRKDSQFLRIHTNKSVYTVANYNSHNGYYGGFSVELQVIRPKAGAW